MSNDEGGKPHGDYFEGATIPAEAMMQGGLNFITTMNADRDNSKIPAETTSTNFKVNKDGNTFIAPGRYPLPETMVAVRGGKEVRVKGLNRTDR